MDGIEILRVLEEIGLSWILKTAIEFFDEVDLSLDSWQRDWKRKHCEFWRLGRTFFIYEIGEVGGYTTAIRLD